LGKARGGATDAGAAFWTGPGINATTSLSDLRLPDLHLEPLKADRKGQYSIRINDRYRICFAWRDGDAYNVEIVDYH
jgi:proteic killer suppression protein